MPRSLLALGAIAALSLLLPACAPQKRGDTRAEFTRNVDHKIDATGVRTLTLRTGPGSLRVIGEAGRREISLEGMLLVEAESFAEAKRIAGEVELASSSERTENPVVEITEPRLVRSGQVHTLDLVVRVPPSVLVSVEDTAGDIEVGGLGAGVRIRGDAGTITVSGVRGGVEIHAAGPSTTIRDSTGRIDIRDGAGTLEITGITGDIVIEDAGGPDLDLAIRNVTGNVTATSGPGAGGEPKCAVVQNVEGDVTLIGISPASQVQGVLGTISYPRKSP